MPSSTSIAAKKSDVDRAQANERNRVRTANRYLKHILYGNRHPTATRRGRSLIQLHCRLLPGCLRSFLTTENTTGFTHAR